MIIGYCLVAPVHLDGDPVPVVAGADLLIRKPDAHYTNYTLTFTLTIDFQDFLRNDIKNDFL